MNKLRSYEDLEKKVAELEIELGSYQSLANNTADLLYRTNVEGLITYISHSVFDLSGYKKEEAIGMNMAREVYLDPAERDTFLDLLRKNGRVNNFEAALKRKDGSIWWASTDAHFVKNEIGEVSGVEGITRDITDLKEAREALADSEQLLSDIIEFLPDPTFVINKNHQVLSWNRSIEELTGIPKNEILGKNNYPYAYPFYQFNRPMLADLVLSPDEQWEATYETLKKVSTDRLLAQSFHPHLAEEGLHLFSTASRIYNAQGDVIGAIESIRDISDLREAELEREKLISDLKESMSEVKTLSGLLPICSSCKKIRDSKGYWNQLENYIEQHSNAEFSHGICNDCAEKIYGYKALKIAKGK